MKNLGHAYFKCQYRYRNLRYVLLAIAFGLVCAVLAVVAVVYPVFMLLGMSEVSVLGILLFDVVGLILACVFFGIARRTLQRVVNDEQLAIEIGPRGILIGDSRYPWRDVGWIGGQRVHLFSSRFNLVFSYPGTNGVITWIPTNSSVPRDEFDELMRRIEAQDVDSGVILSFSRRAMFVHW